MSNTDTQQLVQQFLERGGEVKRLNTMSPVSGAIRYNMAAKRRELEEQGVPVDDMPHWCMTYHEKKARGLLPYQVARRLRQEAERQARIRANSKKKGRK